MDKSVRVLVAEDNANLRKVLVNVIKKIGYENILEADNGKVAWEAVKNDKVELVVTDWSMPVMTGLDLVIKIRAADAPIKNIPILMITAMDTKTSIMAAGKQGVDAYIIKPFSVATIAEKIEEAVSKRAAG